MVKSGCFENLRRWRAHFFFEMQEGCKVSCITIIPWLIVSQELTNTLIFYISDYGAEYGAGHCAESDAK